MPRARWFVIGFLVVTAVIGGILNERGPFGQHPALSYAQFLADFQAGDVGQIVQWRDRLEVTEADRLLLVTVPPDRDLTVDLARAKLAGNVGISWAHVPDAWLGIYTPWVPFLILVAAVLIWATAIVRNRRALSGAGSTGSPQPPLPPARPSPAPTKHEQGVMFASLAARKRPESAPCITGR